MKKYWALIIAYRPHIFALGKHNTFEAAETMAVEFCDKKNKQIQEAYDTARQNVQEGDPEIPEPAPFNLAYIMDDNDMRGLTGEVHRPYVIAKKREEVVVAAPTRQGVGTPSETETEAEPE